MMIKLDNAGNPSGHYAFDFATNFQKKIRIRIELLLIRKIPPLFLEKLSFGPKYQKLRFFSEKEDPDQRDPPPFPEKSGEKKLETLIINIRKCL